MRIIGGRLKNKKLEYTGDSRTRPMKERVREAVFNLVGPSIKGKVAIDLFAGTGAVGLEAVSRGAVSAIFIERHVPTSKIIRQNAEELGVVDQVTIVAQNSFFWVKRLDNGPAEPWAVFICPPYEFFESHQEELLAQIDRMIQIAPSESVLVIEFDARFDPQLLPQADRWDVRVYSPAHVAIMRLEET